MVATALLNHHGQTREGAPAPQAHPGTSLVTLAEMLVDATGAAAVGQQADFHA